VIGWIRLGGIWGGVTVKKTAGWALRVLDRERLPALFLVLCLRLEEYEDTGGENSENKPADGRANRSSYWEGLAA
jgi:hypothetical protein